MNKEQIEKNLKLVGFSEVEIKIISKSIWINQPMGGLPFTGYMKYF